MLEKFKNIFENKEKRTQNLISFLIILVITLIIINRILKEDEEIEDNFENETNVELASSSDTSENDDLEKKLENILRKIDGVGEVAVLITYSESNSIVPIYNVNTNKSTIEETDSNGGKRTTQTEESQTEVIKDSNSDIVTEKVIMPKIEGAIITAEGGANSAVKSNIVSAVEAVTGLATHKIQVFEMGDE